MSGEENARARVQAKTGIVTAQWDERTGEDDADNDRVAMERKLGVRLDQWRSDYSRPGSDIRCGSNYDCGNTEIAIG